MICSSPAGASASLTLVGAVTRQQNKSYLYVVPFRSSQNKRHQIRQLINSQHVVKHAKVTLFWHKIILNWSLSDWDFFSACCAHGIFRWTSATSFSNDSLFTVRHYVWDALWNRWSTHCHILLNRIQLGENPAVLFCFDFYYIKLPQRLELLQIYVFSIFFYYLGVKHPISW